jgi:DNA-binding IclR family transcriptional regulator
MADDPGVRSVARAAAILELFTVDRPALTLSEIGAGAGLSKTTAHRLLGTLRSLELVQVEPESGRYRLGLKLLQLGSLVLHGMELVSEAGPLLQRLVDETHETAFLTVPDGDASLCLRRLDGRHSVRVLFLETGKRLAFNAGAGPRVLLAHMPPEERRRLVADHSVRMTPNTLVSVEDLERDGEIIRRQGFSFSREDVSLHACAVGAPVRDHSGKVVAALSISGIVQRFSDEQVPGLAEAVMRAGEELSRRMGYQVEAAPGGKEQGGHPGRGGGRVMGEGLGWALGGR